MYSPVSQDPKLPPIRINLFSDAQTKPTPAMREAMMRAEVGDEQLGLDPTVNELCERTAALLGKQAAVFLPSGTMCNVAALLTHCRPGEEILAHETSHILTSEGGSHAALGGIQVFPLRGDNGQYSIDTLNAAFRPISRYAPKQVMVSAEQTSNIGGGTIWPRDVLAKVTHVAHERGMVTHLDGARLLNACVAAKVSAQDMAAGWDSVWIDFSKALGAPIGAVLAGSHEFIGNVWRWKQRLGGSMRQAGVCAAACIHALDHHVERLADDHTNARALARGLSQIEGLDVQQPETNLVFLSISSGGITAEKFLAEMRQRGILLTTLGGRIRLVTHLDIAPAMIDEALNAARDVMRTAA